MDAPKIPIHTTIKSDALHALRSFAIYNGFRFNDLLHEAIEQFLEAELLRVKIWLPKAYIVFLQSHNRDLEAIIREPLAMEVYAAYANGEITKAKASEIVKTLGFNFEEL